MRGVAELTIWWYVYATCLTAKFKVSMEVKQGLVALSNGAWLTETNIPNNSKRVDFDWTATQSSYLMAFAVSNFDYINATIAQQPSYPFRVWGQPGRIQAEGHLLANRALQVQEWYGNYTKQPFPLAKQDQIGIPNKGGAMENYGLVTYDHTTSHSLYTRLLTCAFFCRSSHCIPSLLSGCVVLCCVQLC